MAGIEIFNPPEMGAVLGPYSQIARVRASEFIFIAGQVGADASGRIAEGFAAQCEQVHANIAAALTSVGADWSNVVQFTSYLVSADDIAAYRAYREQTYPGFFPGGRYPTNTLLVIDRLVKPEFLLEVQATAAMP
jgi:enamine deaminase RidA (YjgF/YER057c/UK114 family)